MTAAAFQAAFADFKIIRGRKCAQFVFEVPLEAADAALEALGGVPRPDRETWVAIARLTETTTKLVLPSSSAGEAVEVRAAVSPAQDTPTEPCHDEEFGCADPVRLNDKPRRKFHELPLSAQAALRCGQEAFCRYLDERQDNCWGMIDDETDAANCVRTMCRVKSRSEIKEGTAAGRMWKDLESAYQAWFAEAERIG